MRRSTWVAGLCLLVLVAASVARGAAIPWQIRVGIYQNPPKCFVDEAGVPRGIFVDLLDDCARRSGWTVTWVPGTWGGGLEGIREGTLDLMPDVSWSEPRSKIYRFNAEPVLSDWFQIYRRDDVSIESILDLEGRSVAVLRGSVQEQTLGEMAQQFGFDVHLVPMDDYAGAFAAVGKGEVAAVVVNRFYGRWNKVSGVVETPVVFCPTRLHFAGPPGRGDDVMGTLDAYLRVVKNEPSSVYYESLRRWTGERPLTQWPAWLGTAITAVLGLTFLALLWLLALRWQVRRRTAELRFALDELERTRAEALRLERLHVVGQMAGGLAHDFNNILSPVVGYADLLLSEPGMLKDPAAVTSALEAILLAANEGADIVRRLRAVQSQRGEARPERVDVRAAVADAIRLARPRWRRPKTALGTVTVAEELKRVPDVFVVPGELRDAVVNLICNAVDALPDGGTIRVGTEEAAGCVVVSVADDGAGMTAEVRQNCLRPFFTTKGEAGTGLGLAQVVMAVDRANGRLEIESEPGRGAHVRLILPAVPREEAESEDGTAGGGEGPARRILAVDDDSRALSALTAMLEADGHHVTALNDASMALELLKTGDFDLVVSDRAMPGMTGDALGRALRKEGLGVPLVLVSGLPEEALPPAEATLVLRKPLTRQRIREALAEIGRG